MTAAVCPFDACRRQMILTTGVKIVQAPAKVLTLPLYTCAQSLMASLRQSTPAWSSRRHPVQQYLRVSVVYLESLRATDISRRRRAIFSRALVTA